MQKTTIRLENVKRVNGFIIKRRVSRFRRALHIPLYSVWTRDGRCLEDFRQLKPAIRWCEANSLTVAAPSPEDTEERFNRNLRAHNTAELSR
jgi:hypothetical protein